MNLPFGFFPPNLRFNRGKDEKTPLTRKQMNQRESYRLQQGIQGGLNSGNIFGSVMGFMGLPWLSRGARNSGKGGYPAPSWVSPYDFLGNGMSGSSFGGSGNGGGGGGGGGGNNGNGGGGGPGNLADWTPPTLMYPPPIGTGEQWRNTMRYGA